MKNISSKSTEKAGDCMCGCVDACEEYEKCSKLNEKKKILKKFENHIFNGHNCKSGSFSFRLSFPQKFRNSLNLEIKDYEVFSCKSLKDAESCVCLLALKDFYNKGFLDDHINPVLFKLGIKKAEDHESKSKLVEEDEDDVDYQMLYQDMKQLLDEDGGKGNGVGDYLDNESRKNINKMNNEFKEYIHKSISIIEKCKSQKAKRNSKKASSTTMFSQTDTLFTSSLPITVVPFIPPEISLNKIRSIWFSSELFNSPSFTPSFTPFFPSLPLSSTSSSSSSSSVSPIELHLCVFLIYPETVFIPSSTKTKMRCKPSGDKNLETENLKNIKGDIFNNGTKFVNDLLDLEEINLDDVEVVELENDLPCLYFPFGMVTHTPLDLTPHSSSFSMLIPSCALSSLGWDGMINIVEAVDILKRRQLNLNNKNFSMENSGKDNFDFSLKCKVIVSTNINNVRENFIAPPHPPPAAFSLSHEEFKVLLFFHAVLFEKKSILKYLHYGEYKNENAEDSQKDSSLGEKILDLIYSKFFSRYDKVKVFCDKKNERNNPEDCEKEKKKEKRKDEGEDIFPFSGHCNADAPCYLVVPLVGPDRLFSSPDSVAYLINWHFISQVVTPTLFPKFYAGSKFAGSHNYFLIINIYFFLS
jgi:hypothetical protein